MYNEQLEQLIDAALTDGELTVKEKQVLFKKAMMMGVDLDEFEIVLDARLAKKKKETEEKKASAPKSKNIEDLKDIEPLIDAALIDGELSDKEKQVLFKKAMTMGLDLDVFELVVDARLTKMKKDAEEKAKAAAPKSNKYGDVKKCPACGAIVPQLTGFCVECGYEFSNVGVTLSSQQLADKIETIRQETAKKKSELRMSGRYSTFKDEGDVYSPLEKALDGLDSECSSQIDSMVESFPIPNSKSELYDFISFLRMNEYSEKLKESIRKAEQLFPKDEMFQKIASEVKKEEKKEKRGELILTVCGIIILLLSLLGSLLFG